MKIIVEYIWIDGQKPTTKMRSKTRVIDLPEATLENIPPWGFDGSSTCQATTRHSDCVLQPVRLFPDPIRGEPNILVLCEVNLPNGRPHQSNTRAVLNQAAKRYLDQKALFGIEQEYTLYDKNGVRPLRWPEGAGFPHPQGRYYCGVGCDEVYGRSLIEAHTSACLLARLAISGTNAEVMPSQWEFQVGTLPAPDIGDQVWLARWLLYRLGENFGITAKLDPKPIDGDWNGAGAHTNFSTERMRAAGGLSEIKKAAGRLADRHHEHIQPHIYGADNHLRLTGKHETCSIEKFRWGIGDRGASVRIPAPVAEKGCGYLEDRRPAANADPYRVATALLETICGRGFNSKKFSFFLR